MGILSKIFRSSPENPQTSLNKPSLWLSNWFAGSSKAGVSVNTNTAQGMTAVWRAVSLIAESLASLPLEVYRKNGNRLELAEDDIRHYLINKRPNTLETSYLLRETAQSHLCFHGNTYIRIIRDANGFPAALDLEHNPRQVDILINEQGVKFYKFPKYSMPWEASDVIHIVGFGYDGLKGKSPVQVHRESLGLGIAVQDYASNIYKNGTHTQGVLETERDLTDDQFTSLAKSWNARTGLDNTGKTPILEGGVKYKPIGLSPIDAQYLDSRKYNVEEISRIYGVPLHLLSSLDRATFSNINHLDMSFVKYTLRSWLKRWEQELNVKLFSKSDQNNMFVRFNVDALLRGDIQTRTEAYKNLFYAGAINPNEIRAFENMNGYDGGDRYFIPVNVAPSSLVDQIFTKKENTQ